MRTHAYWRAANYLSVGQSYLKDKSPSRGSAQTRAYQAAIARRWEMTTGLNFLYIYLNRLRKMIENGRSLHEGSEID